jgi:hypothetical protein
MNIRPDTVLHQVISELLGKPAPVTAPASAPAQPAVKKATTASAPAAPAAPAPAQPAQVRPRGSIVNILA